ncbi:DUF4386 family protein [Gudongella oleilytica]|uniref:DUF4386 family protein n=1 Tax=Gudongella oleilytica TaxID=1582259 RepID=UPI000FF89B58|nr:DUF4386 family protein [Gudongella oleilytica]
MGTDQWKPLYKLAGWCALAMFALVPLQIVLYIVFPPPSTVEGFFALYRNNWLLGLLSLDLLYIINTIVLIPIYIALIMSLRDVSFSAALLAAVLGVIGISAYFPSNVAFEMLSLSERYFSADTVIQGQIIIAAGEAAIARYTGSTFNVYYILNAIVLIIISALMLRSNIYARVIGWSGLISGILMSIPSSFGMIGLIFSLLSLIPWLIFTFFLIFKFKKLGSEITITDVGPIY